ncbi:hypothetical protein H0X48_00945 [Candidatus Dependentiae bacterium]|nr:hypothetical protein [Candidatus Dependentiae bacterium]
MRILLVFCIIDDILKSIGFNDDWQVKMSSSEIMTIAVAAAIFFGGNTNKSCSYFFEHKYVKKWSVKISLT